MAEKAVFPELIGNERLKALFADGLRRGRGAHAYVLEGPAGSGRHTAARLIAAASLCENRDDPASPLPCGRCLSCRKVLSGHSVDVLTVSRGERATLGVEPIRELRDSLWVTPNDGDRKFYFIEDAHLMTPQAQNALLKVLEEPPAYGAFLLLADRAEAMLPTVRSRCVEMQLLPVPERETLPLLRREFPDKDDAALRRALRLGGGWIGQAAMLLREETGLDPLAEELCVGFEKQDALALTRTLCKLERRKREQLLPVLRQTREILAQALARRSGAPSEQEEIPLASARTAADLMRACRVLQEAIRAAEANVGVGHVCGYLTVSLR